MTAAAAIPLEPLDGVAQVRARMFAVFVHEMNRSRIPYCLLSGHKQFPDPGESDVDFMVLAKDACRVASLLQGVARLTGALLVQGLQHETGAWYFVLAKRVGDEVAYFHPDCTTDYRCGGRLWMRAADVVSRCRQKHDFHVPAEEDEFLYYLIKKVLKQSISREQMRRLRTLYVARPERCRACLRGFLRTDTVGALVSSLLRLDEEQMCLMLPKLLWELQVSEPVESWPARLAQSQRELMRRARRVLQPTGMSLGVRGGSVQERCELIAVLERNLKPAFRGTLVVAENAKRSSMQMWMARVRSTLVLTSASAPKTASRAIWWEMTGTLEDEGRSATDLALRAMAGRTTRREGRTRTLGLH